MPLATAQKISSLTAAQKAALSEVPCLVFSKSEAKEVDHIVSLAHGKGEKARRDKWTAVATARHSRDILGSSEPALDLLEKYLKSGQNVTPEQATRWSGDYPLTVLAEAMGMLAPRLGCATSREMEHSYPNSLDHRSDVENVIHDIGMGLLGFSHLRGEADFGAEYNMPAPAAAAAGNDQASNDGASGNAAGATDAGSEGAASDTTDAGEENAQPSKRRGGAAYSATDVRSVRKALRELKPRGKNRQKLVQLRDEAKSLNIRTHPYSFCFVLRSMFEISAKAYCKDHQIAATTQNGNDKNLGELLSEVTNHLTGNGRNRESQRALHGAITELRKSNSFLSVTSMNQLIHNPRFFVDESHICILFHNVLPLLEAMNA